MKPRHRETQARKETHPLVFWSFPCSKQSEKGITSFLLPLTHLAIIRSQSLCPQNQWALYSCRRQTIELEAEQLGDPGLKCHQSKVLQNDRMGKVGPTALGCLVPLQFFVLNSFYYISNLFGLSKKQVVLRGPQEIKDHKIT